MTLRAAGLLVGGAGLAVWGWFAGWPELTALGAAAVTLVVLVLLFAGPAPRVRVALDQAALRVVRGQEAAVRMKLHLPGAGVGSGSSRDRRPRRLRPRH